MKIKTKLFFLFIFFTLSLSSSFIWGLSVKSLTLKQMVDLSDRIVRLTVTDIRYGEEGGRPVKYITGSVDEWIKGNGSDKLVFAQLAETSEDAGDLKVSSRQGLPTYEVNKTYLLMLAGDSETSGLTAPIGIYQGHMMLEKLNGKWVVPSLKTRPALIKALGKPGNSYDDLKSAIKNILED